MHAEKLASEKSVIGTCNGEGVGRFRCTLFYATELKRYGLEMPTHLICLHHQDPQQLLAR